MATIKKCIGSLGIIGIFTFTLFVVTAQAAEPIDCVVCSDSTMTSIVQTKDLIIMGYENRGIVLDNTASKFWDSDTTHGVGIVKIDKGKVTVSNISKHTAPNGDFYVTESSRVGPSPESNWKFIYGTGKFAGVTGSGKSIPFTKAKPDSPGISQGCVKVSGTYELKK